MDRAERFFKDQIIAGTRLDLHGERIPKAKLDEYCQSMPGRHWLNHKHDMSLPPTGYYENVRVVPSALEEGEWDLIADVTITYGTIEENIGGFSIGYTELIVERDGAEAAVFLPYPFYNDAELIESLASDQTIEVGKWVQKSAEPVLWSLIGAGFVWLAGKLFDKTFDEFLDRTYVPQVRKILDFVLPKLEEKGLSAQVNIPAAMGNIPISLQIQPPPNTGKEYLSNPHIAQAIRAANASLLAGDARPETITRIVLGYDFSGQAYQVIRTVRRTDIKA